ncbi:putative nuclease HARBI1 [Merluccius polli]|uniref:Putative nuclease HARBI1 n=1 Tax=Merluccius polli TaxID=89951 RepID=A0AA47NVE2_MERPO|nr:putative nuclease HARBI1 [Merluccius polli]
MRSPRTGPCSITAQRIKYSSGEGYQTAHRCSLSRQLSFPDNDLFQRYRFTSQSIIYIHNLIRPYICNITNRSHALTSQQIVCCTAFLCKWKFFVHCRRCRALEQGNCIHENMSALALLEDLARDMRHERVFRDHQDYLAHEDEWLTSRFRLPRAILLQICAELAPALRRPTRRNRSIPVQVQVLTTLGFLATGTFQRELADMSGISQPSLSVIMPAVWRGLIALTPRCIKFPYAAVEQANIKTQFVAMSSFPNVIGAIDGTHVAIKAPTTDEYAYVNRKQYHSVNVQIICDAEITFLNVVARWPGSTHDSFMLRQSSVGRRLQAGAVQDGWLLGDSGYPLTSWLLTPFPNPQNQAQQTYRAQVVERSIGLLKSRWRCLDKSGGVLQYTPEKLPYCPMTWVRMQRLRTTLLEQLNCANT